MQGDKNTVRGKLTICRNPVTQGTARHEVPGASPYKYAIKNDFEWKSPELEMLADDFKYFAYVISCKLTLDGKSRILGSTPSCEVEFFPFMRHLPDWLSEWRRWGLRWFHEDTELLESMLKGAQEIRVRILFQIDTFIRLT